MMGDPREYEGGNSDDEEVLPEAGDDDLPLNDGEEEIEEEDAG